MDTNLVLIDGLTALAFSICDGLHQRPSGLAPKMTKFQLEWSSDVPLIVNSISYFKYSAAFQIQANRYRFGKVQIVLSIGHVTQFELGHRIVSILHMS